MAYHQTRGTESKKNLAAGFLGHTNTVLTMTRIWDDTAGIA
jgi:hypothetical protein